MNKNPLLHLSALLSVSAVQLLGKPKKAGGQAIIEGVMMRSRSKISLAVRKPDGSLFLEQSTFVSARIKSRILRFPVIRGAVNLYESLVIGYRALSRSAEIAMTADQANAGKQKSSKFSDALATWGTLAFALAVSMGIFMYLPMWLLSHFVSKESAIAFNAGTGAIRIVLLVLYLFLISLWNDMRRIFEYHGAEHMAIFTFEDGKDLTCDNMRPYPTLHPRCGTSFLLLTGLVCVFLFSIIDALVITLIGPYPNVFFRFLVHVLLIPLVAGSSYEVLKLSDRYKQVPLVGALILPGLWLQKITTKKPDDSQLEVAAAALKAVV